MERDPLMLNQRLMLMLTMDTMDMPDLMPMDTEPMDTHTDMDIMARDLLMPSPRLRLTQLSSGLQPPPRHQRQQCSSCQGCRQHCPLGQHRLQCRCPHPSGQDCCHHPSCVQHCRPPPSCLQHCCPHPPCQHRLQHPPTHPLLGQRCSSCHHHCLQERG